MSGVEVLAGLGLLATELFKYNRENYEFDQDQRFEREECRLKMQVERFSLFREDIRDLVELTVKKMDLYHLVGALFLKMVVLYYCVGFFENAPPPFILCLYYLSNGCSWVYLMLAIWLSMHASISSHSYGTRLLTRFVRLPIPGSAQINVLNARYADFEKQGVQMWRVPFMKRKANTWQQRSANGGLEREPSMGPKPSSSSQRATTDGQSSGFKEGVGGDWLGSGEYAYGGQDDIAGREAEMLRAVEFRTHRHVQLFRHLQSQWQCFDAYARVAMALGVRQMIQSLTYYLIGICMVDQQAPMAAYVLTVCLQALGTAISILDIHGLPCYGNLDLSLVGALPAIITVISLSLASRTEEGILYVDNVYILSLACYPLEVCWLHLLLWAASPTDPSCSLPRHFRAVLFMDVFSDLDDPNDTDPQTGARILDPQERTVAEARVEGACSALQQAHAALRRWEAVPRNWQTRERNKQLKQAAKELDYWLEAFVRQLELHHLPALPSEMEERRAWEEMSTAEREEDPYTGSVLGPFEQFTGMGLATKYYYDLESNEYLYEPLPNHRRIFTVAEVGEAVRSFANEVEAVCSATRSARPTRASDAGDESGDESYDNSPLTRARSVSSFTKNHAPRDVDENVAKVKPNRLPWQLVNFLTRAVQLVWIYVGIMAILRETRFYTVDWQELEGKFGERRLEPTDPSLDWMFEDMGVIWPSTGLFRPHSLSCRPEAASHDGWLRVGSPFASYEAVARAGTHEFTELSVESFPPGSIMLCGPLSRQTEGVAFSPECLVGSLTSTGQVAVWPWVRSRTEAHVFQIDGQPWRLLAGALVQCGQVARLAEPSEFDNATNPAFQDWCMLLIGSPSPDRLLVTSSPVARDPLAPFGPGESQLALHFEFSATPPDQEIPVNHADLRNALGSAGSLATKDAAEMVTLQADPDSGWLWVLMADHSVRVWDLLEGQPRFLGLRRPQWPLAVQGLGGFQPTGLCADAVGETVFVVGRAGNGVGKPALLRAAMPLLRRRRKP